MLFRLIEEGSHCCNLEKKKPQHTFVGVACAHGSAKEKLGTTCLMFYMPFLFSPMEFWIFKLRLCHHQFFFGLV